MQARDDAEREVGQAEGREYAGMSVRSLRPVQLQGERAVMYACASVGDGRDDG